MKCIDSSLVRRSQYILGALAASVSLLLISLPRPVNVNDTILAHPVAGLHADGSWSISEQTVAIYRDVTMAEMLAELAVIRETLLASSHQEAKLLAASIEELAEALHQTFLVNREHAYHELEAGQKEAYNEVALLIADLKILLQEMTNQEERTIVSFFTAT